MEAHGSAADGSFVRRLFQMLVYPVSSLSQFIRVFRESVKAKVSMTSPALFQPGLKNCSEKNVEFEEVESPVNLKEIPANDLPTDLLAQRLEFWQIGSFPWIPWPSRIIMEPQILHQSMRYQ